MDSGLDQIWLKELQVEKNTTSTEFKAKISQLKVDNEIGEESLKKQVFPQGDAQHVKSNTYNQTKQQNISYFMKMISCQKSKIW